MRAVVIKSQGEIDGISLAEVDQPELSGGDAVRVRVHAAGLNRADIMQRRGKYPAPPGYPQEIPGLEFAGEVEAIGNAVTQWKIGDRVFGITAGGGQAEFVVAPASNLARIPDELDWVEAGAIPEVFITAHDALFTQARLAQDERVLIHAAGSGVGTAAVQLAHAAGATVYGTSRTADKLKRVREYGMDDGVTVADAPEKFVEAVQRWTGDHGVDVILDLVGGFYLPADLQAVAARGRIVCLATTAGAKAEIDIRRLMQKRATIIGSVLRGRSITDKAKATRRFAEDVLPLLSRGVVRPVIEMVYAAEEIGAAHRHLETNTSFGKIVLTFS
jgi:putative PIG3 family NAD(P)H quinone oxidoreductase